MITRWYQAQIYYWMMTNPAKLFLKINALGWYENMLHNWIADLALPDKSKVLELGCAAGSLSEYLAECDFVVTGIDASNKMIKSAKSRPNYKATYQQANAKALPFSDAVFDGVISASLLNIIDEPELVVSEMVRNCKPGGLVSILVPKQGISDTIVKHLIRQNCTSGFSAAALRTWHQRAPKLHPDELTVWMRDVGISNLQKREYLDGLVVTVSGNKVRTN